MKKILFFMLALVLLATPMVNAQNRQLVKEEKKEYKKKMKKYASEKWEVFGTSRTLEVLLLMHYDKLNDEGVEEITTQTISTHKNLAKEKLLMRNPGWGGRGSGITCPE